MANLQGLWVGLSSLEANGAVREYQKSLAGHYEIGIGTVPYSPSPGIVHFAAYVEDHDSKLRYSNAEVLLTGLGPVTDGKPRSVIESTSMNNAVLDPTSYEVNVPLNQEGVWTITIEVSAEKGTAESVFEIEVQETDPVVPTLTLLALIGFLIILGMSARAWVKEYRKKQQLSQTFLGGMLILMIGFLTVESLEQSPIFYDSYVEYNQEFMEIDTTAYLEDMALFLLDSDGDIYETATFLYELDLDLLNQEKDI